MRITRYILGPDHVPMPEPDLLKWAAWLETAECRVAQTPLADGQVVVSTVFLGLDHAHVRDPGPRQLFETLVLYHDPGPPPAHRTGAMARYATWDQAQAGHRRMVDEVRGAMAWQEDRR